MASEPKSDTHRARTLGWLDMPHPTRTHPPFAPSTAGRRRSGLTDRSIDRSVGGLGHRSSLAPREMAGHFRERTAFPTRHSACYISLFVR